MNTMGNVLKFLCFLCFFISSVAKLTGQEAGRLSVAVRQAPGQAVASDEVKPPLVTRLLPPAIVRAGAPRIITRTESKRSGGPATSVSFPISKTEVPGRADLLPPRIAALRNLPFLAPPPEKVLAHSPRKRNSGPANILTYGLSSGLKDEIVTRMQQDERHNLWGTTAYGGAFKFDGKYFHWFTEAQGLTNNTSGLLLAADEDIWFGTISGISRYDGKFMTNYTTEHGLAQNWSLNYDEDKHGNIWISSIDVLQMIDSRQDSVYIFGEDGDSSYDYSTLKADQRGNLWIAIGEKGFMVVVPEKKGNDLIFKFHYFLRDIGTIRFFHEDQEGNMWLGTSNGVYEISNITETYDELKSTKYDLGFMERPDLFITGIQKTDEGKVWVSTRSGLFVLDRSVDQSPATFTYLGTPQDIPHSSVNGIFQDRNQNVWIGGGGLSLKQKKPFRIFETIKNPSCIVEDQRGNLWVGSARGLYRYDPDQPNQVLLYTTAEGLPPGNIVDLIIGPRGRVWIAISGFGLSIFEPGDAGGRDTFTNYPGASLPSSFPTSFFRTPNGSVWTAFYTNPVDTLGGIIKIEGDELTFIGTPQGLMNEDVMAMDCDTRGRFWIGSWGEGINQYKPAESPKPAQITYYTSKTIPLENRVRTVLADRKGNVWVGGYGGGGITQFFPSSEGEANQIRHYSLTQGLSSGTLLSALEDAEGNLWFGTAYGLNLLRADQVEQPTNPVPIIAFTEADGFPAKSSARNVLFQSSDGLIWVGGDSHLIYFDPKELIHEPAPPPLELLQVSLFNQPIAWQKDSSFVLADGKKVQDVDFDSLSRFNQLPQNLSLYHQNNFVDFDYVGISIDAPHKVNYQTQLVGLERNWSVPTVKSSVSYNGLQPGNFVFKMRARIGKGEWSDPLSYSFRIRPPWWERWWAYAAYSLLTTFLLFGTYRFQLKRKLETAEAIRLQELDATKSRLYTNITHEFRTPLTVISGMTAKVQEEPDKWLRKGLPMIDRNTQRLLSLVNQLLDLSKLESGKMAVTMKQGDIISYLRYITESILSLAESKQIRVHFSTEREELTMDFDPEKIQKIVTNLLTNAVKFTPEGEQINISVQQVHDGGKSTAAFSGASTLKIVVQDTGVGISAQQLPFIFDRFYQTDDSTTRPEEGTGIGLALVKELLKLLEGSITAISEDGPGATFVITLPIRNQAPRWEGLLPAQLDRPSAGMASVGLATMGGTTEGDPEDDSRMSVLLIEDNPDVLAYMSVLLHKDYALKVAQDGQAGVEMAFENIPDLVITDVMMPNKDGFEVCQILKKDERTSHIPIIMLTAKADIESKLEGLEGGADAYLIKPFHEKELRIRIQKLLELRGKLQEYYRSLARISNNTSEEVAVAEIVTQEHHFVKKLRGIVESHLDDSSFTVDEFCQEVGMSSSHLHRKLTALTGLSPNKFIRHIRLHEAKELLLVPEVNVSDVAYRTGFNNPGYFSRAFKKEFAMTPKEWKQRWAEFH